MLTQLTCIYFLLAIAQVESSGGINTNHIGPAMGVYGLMPSVILDTKNRNKELWLYDFEQHTIAMKHCEYIHEKFNGDVNRMAYSWFWGISGTYKSYSKHNWYVKRFNKHWRDYGF